MIDPRKAGKKALADEVWRLRKLLETSFRNGFERAAQVFRQQVERRDSAYFRIHSDLRRVHALATRKLEFGDRDEALGLLSEIATALRETFARDHAAALLGEDEFWSPEPPDDTARLWLVRDPSRFMFLGERPRQAPEGEVLAVRHPKLKGEFGFQVCYLFARDFGEGRWTCRPLLLADVRWAPCPDTDPNLVEDSEQNEGKEPPA